MKKLLTTALLLLTMVGSAAPSFAEDLPVKDLQAALRARGITTYLDAKRCQTHPVAGFYVGAYKSLIICSGGKLDLNEDQLDTYRHETLHFIQDCKNGKIDGELEKVFRPEEEPELVKALAAKGLSAERIKKIYESHGDGDAVPFELEAFLAGKMTNRQVLNLMNTFCPLKKP